VNERTTTRAPRKPSVSGAVTIAGTTMLDDTTSPAGRKLGLLGGSAPYAALAAARYCRVRLVSVVGADGLDKLRTAFADRDIDLSDLIISQEPSFREVTLHEDLDGRTVLISSERNCFDAWNPVMSAAATLAPICFVGSAPPDVQLRLIDQTRARVVGVDTMTSHLTETPQLALAVLERADYLFLNEQELAVVGELLHIPAHLRADVTELGCSILSLLAGRVLIVKRGPAGVVVATQRETFSLPAVSVPQVRDPTGAGDALAGGIFGALGRIPSSRHADLRKLVHEGLRCAALAISEFGVVGLRRRTP
jgi:sugar/nucleoside kinase (ribokinase family)